VTHERVRLASGTANSRPGASSDTQISRGYLAAPAQVPAAASAPLPALAGSLSAAAEIRLAARASSANPFAAALRSIAAACRAAVGRSPPASATQAVTERSWVTWSDGLAREGVPVFRHGRGRRESWRDPPSLSRFRHGALRGSSHGPILWPGSCHTYIIAST
jgi:hypothetical protein